MVEENSEPRPIRQYAAETPAGQARIRFIEPHDDEFERLLFKGSADFVVSRQCPFDGADIREQKVEGGSILIEHPIAKPRLWCICSACASRPVEELLTLALVCMAATAEV
ncbi:MAG: hypothetical protein J0H44_13620 [Alphaproteobacteria bacterium]|nr:hypothetical protein [Alphaproteobacteria bacterium]